VSAELRQFVLQCIERVRVARDDAFHAEVVQRLDQCGGQLLEHHLVAKAAHALAGGTLLRARMPSLMPAACATRTKARAIFCPRGSKEEAEPT